MPSIPPLPDRWPYGPRAALPEAETHAGIAVPGQAGRWEVVAADLPPDLPAEPLGGAYGRGGIYRLGDWVVRPYRRGGLVRHLNRSVYLDGRRFPREYEVHAALWSAGFPTVEPLGFARRARGPGWQGLCFTRWTPAAPWPSDWSAGLRALPAIVQLLAALCDWGLWAPDLNATNLLLQADGTPLALDWDRAAWKPGADLQAKYVHRLVRSLARLGAPDAVSAAFAEACAAPWSAP